MAEPDFLTFLVDETLKLQKSGGSELSTLELKLKDYGLAYLKGEFIPQYRILRFHAPFGHLDVPVNWSVFEILESDHPEHVLSKDHDPDHFFAVLTKAWDPQISKLLVTHADGFCYLVGLRVGEDNHLHDLLSPQELLRAA